MRRQLTIPDLARASDEEIEALFPSFDGRWSRQTKGLLTSHGADRLNLDANWASVPQDWHCEGCGRSKPDLARKSPAGVLICRLDWHHDHLRDYGKRVLRNKVHRPDDPEAFRRWFSATDACKHLIERFHPAFLCVDCNAADGEAKRRLRGVVHPDFSFSPSEIAAFVTPSPGRPHALDLEAARAAWNEVEDDVADRIAFVAVLAQRVAEGRLQRHGRRRFSEDSLRPILRDLARADEEGGLALARLPQDLAERSVKDDGFRSSLKPRNASVRIPTREEFEAYTAAQDPRSPWVWYDADWRCPACDRSRFECLRASGSGKWTGRLHRLWTYSEETDAGALLLRNGWNEGWLTYRAHGEVYLCQDCRLVITDTNKSLSDPSDDCLRVADLRRLVVQAAPHVRPAVDLTKAVALAGENDEHIVAARAYWRHRSDAIAVAAEFEHLIKRGAPREDALWIALDRLGRYDLEESDMAPMLEFLVSEAERFHAEDRAWSAAQPPRPVAGH